MLQNKLFTTVLYYFGKSRPFACTYFFDHPVYSGWPVVFCLENDPQNLISLDYKSLKERMKKPGKFIRNVPLKNPVLLNINYAMKFSPFDIIGLEKINERADVIKNNPEFIERCKKAIIEINDEKSKLYNEDPITANDPHNLLYSNKYEFISDNSHSGKLMKEFHLIDWDKRYGHVLKFQDLRLRYFGLRLIYQNKPEALPKEVYDTIHVETAERVLRLEEKNFTTIPMAEHLIDSIRAEKDITKEKLDYINEVDAMIKEMRVIYEKALVLRTGLSKRAYGLEQAEKQRIEAEKFSKLFEPEIPKENASTKKTKKDIA